MTASGLSYRRLARMHEVLGQHVASGELTGLTALIARRGEVHADGIGAVTDDGAKVGRDTIFRIATCSPSPWAWA